MRPRRLAGPTTTAARPAVGELTTAFPFLPYFSAGFQEYIKNPRRTDNPNTNGYAFSGEATGSLVAHCKLQGHLLQNLFGWGGQYWRAAAAAAARRPPAPIAPGPPAPRPPAPVRSPPPGRPRRAQAVQRAQDHRRPDGRAGGAARVRRLGGALSPRPQGPPPLPHTLAAPQKLSPCPVFCLPGPSSPTWPP